MKITIINVSGRMSSDGSRLISALLKEANHEVKNLFLARPEPLMYQHSELEQLNGILNKTDLVMIAVYSSYANRAVQVSDFIHSNYPGMQVIWGGPHCIAAPQLCLRYADGVCFSEGDQAVIELVEKMEAGKDYHDTPNMAFNINGRQVVNRVLPPFSDLDSLPYHDYDLDDHYLLDGNLVHMNKNRLRERLAGYPYYIPILYFVTSRGCPHKCAYCNNCRYVDMFGRTSIRLQSTDRVIDELVCTLKKLDFISFIGIGDDDFFVRSKGQIDAFARKYKEKVGLPFGVAVSANTFSEDKMDMLVDAGLKAVQMGVQSGSERVLKEVYNRKIKASRTKSVLEKLNFYQNASGVDVLVDFIIDNPYESRDDIAQSYKLIAELPRSIKMNIFYLSFFPGTPIYERALKDGIIEPFSEKSFRFFTRSHIRYQKNYETMLIIFARFLRQHKNIGKYIPNTLLRLIGCKSFRSIASILPKRFYEFMAEILK